MSTAASARRRRGRFAPSPTGPLHFGSLVAAVGSFADARATDGEWLVRIEDLDRTREVPGAADSILHALDAFGLHWSGSVWYQSRRADTYAAAMERLCAQGLAYECGCSRREIALAGRQGPEGPIYPGTCRNGLPPGRRPRSLRLRVDDSELRFTDRIQGVCRQRLAEAVGDFLLRRADGIPAYQLAVVVDDAAQGITHIVRGADLLLSTPRQIRLQQHLRLPHPRYAHLPLAIDDHHRKLSKSLAALPVNPEKPLPALLAAWSFLGQRLPPEAPPDLATFWEWALSAWDASLVPAKPCQRVPTLLAPTSNTDRCH